MVLTLSESLKNKALERIDDLENDEPLEFERSFFISKKELKNGFTPIGEIDHKGIIYFIYQKMS